MNKILILCCLSILFFSCDKEKLKPLEEGGPVYYISGKMNYQDWSIIGGYDKYFLFSDYERDGNVNKFISTFKQSDCNTGCANTFTFNFWDNKATDAGTSVDIFHSIPTGDYQFDQVDDPDKFSKVNIEWVDAQNKTYSSNAATQPDSSFFKVVSVSHYDKNHNNKPTVKAEVKINCKLFNISDTTDVIIFNKSFGVFGIAYP